MDENGVMKPQMNADERGCNPADPSSTPLDKLTEQVIGCAYAVSSGLGCGFLEKVYENALAHEMRKAKLPFVQQSPIQVKYDGITVGDYIADFVVNQRLILELKAVKDIDQNQIAQTINYLRAVDHRIGLILNFGRPKLQIKRLVHNL